MRLLIATLLLSACTGVSLSPDVYCQKGRADGLTLYEKAMDRWEECALMIRVTIDSYTGS